MYFQPTCGEIQGFWLLKDQNDCWMIWTVCWRKEALQWLKFHSPYGTRKCLQEGFPFHTACECSLPVIFTMCAVVYRSYIETVRHTNTQWSSNTIQLNNLKVIYSQWVHLPKVPHFKWTNLILHCPVTYLTGKTFYVPVKVSRNTLPPSWWFENGPISGTFCTRSFCNPALLCCEQGRRTAQLLPAHSLVLSSLSKFGAEKSECRMGFEKTWEPRQVFMGDKHSSAVVHASLPICCWPWNLLDLDLCNFTQKASLPLLIAEIIPDLKDGE